MYYSSYCSFGVFVFIFCRKDLISSVRVRCKFKEDSNLRFVPDLTEEKVKLPVYDMIWQLKNVLHQFHCKAIHPSLLDSVSCATSHEAHFTCIVIIHLPHHRLETDKTPGGAFVLFLSYGSANLPDDCWSAQVHHEHPAGSTGTKLPLYPTP
ncbi:hypothetical protein T03_4398, partial [Trichinella britovi]